MEHSKKKLRRESSLPPEICRPFYLENQLQTELQLPHGRALLDVPDLASVAADTVDTGTARSAKVLGTEAQNRVVEHVERIHAELRRETLAHFEVLRNRHVVTEVTWTTE